MVKPRWKYDIPFDLLSQVWSSRDNQETSEVVSIEHHNGVPLLPHLRPITGVTNPSAIY